MNNAIKLKWCTIYYALCSALTIQSILTIGTLPILIYAGLPLTPLGFLGNIIFVPFLTLFLGLSFLFFIGLLFHVYFWPLAWTINTLTYYWLQFLSLGAQYGIKIYFPVHPWIPQVLCWGLVVLLIHVRALRKNAVRWCISSVIACVLCILLLRITCVPKKYIEYKERNYQLNFTLESGSIIVNDFSHHVRTTSYENFLSFTLIPLLAKTFGTTKIIHYYIHQKGPSLPPYAKKLQEDPRFEKNLTITICQIPAQ